MACDNLQLVFTASKTNPFVNESITCTATVTNTGTTTEKYHIVYTVDGSEFTRTNTISINPGVGNSSSFDVTLGVAGSPSVCATLVCDTVSANSITLTSPNGGETWQRGTPHTVTWTYTGDVGSTVKMYLYKAGILIGNINPYDAAPVGSGGVGSYSWTIGASGSTGSDFQLTIGSVEVPGVTDISNGYFTITPSSSTITLTSPNGGETWQRGTTKTVTWTYSGTVGSTVNLDLYQAGVYVGTFGDHVPIGSNGTGSYNWNLFPTGRLGSDFTVRISANDVLNLYDVSNGYFTLV